MTTFRFDMKHSALTRRSPLKRGPGPKRKVRVKAVNRRRKKKRADEGKVYGPYHRRASALPCHFAGPECFGVVTGHHVKTVATGGGDYANEWPACVVHHAKAHAGEIPKDEQRRIALEYVDA